MDGSAELGEFLRARRALLRPQDVGLSLRDDRRDAPGLRREELAQLAGISTAYYTRLEQGRSRQASQGVLDAIARALQLSDADTAHLRRLARPRRAARRTLEHPESARDTSRRLVAAMEHVPAVIVDRRSTVLVWNPLGHALLAGHVDADRPDNLEARPNLARILFLDTCARKLYPRWETEARRCVASLRLASRNHPTDRLLADLVGELSMKSREFAGLWTQRPLLNCSFGTVYVHHPLTGGMELSFQTLQILDTSGHRLITYHARPCSESEASLRSLEKLI
ncbi:helix-turn-helix transcriptional regulator [Streptomyces sp. RB6PN25]|uniref:Helix-turn-helix transcriptional regulator n=1 Tax=Streptomyces humicola TaxID=2953240 RepID=A0ABT1PPY9_9ACTN|nr:helix-turn-helix transcriptional regulator [Streptomyces humicola]MCQ4079758.1 helix-turn-helix transcriptional regulator [Streptomyces humicola]